MTQPWLTVDPARPSGRMLWDGGVRQSYVDLQNPTRLEFVYTQRIADVVDTLFTPPTALRAVHLGGGALTVPRWLAATRPGSTSTVFEVDPGVAAAAATLGPVAGVQVQITDAGAGLAAWPSTSAELIVGDAFAGRVVPAHLLDAPFVAQVYRVLTPRGAYVLNLIDDPPFARARAALATLLTTWPQVGMVAAPELVSRRDGGNLVVVASTPEVDWPGLARRAARREEHPIVLDTAGTVRWCAGTG